MREEAVHQRRANRKAARLACLEEAAAFDDEDEVDEEEKESPRKDEEEKDSKATRESEEGEAVEVEAEKNVEKTNCTLGILWKFMEILMKNYFWQKIFQLQKNGQIVILMYLFNPNHLL